MFLFLSYYNTMDIIGYIFEKHYNIITLLELLEGGLRFQYLFIFSNFEPGWCNFHHGLSQYYIIVIHWLLSTMQ